MLIFAVNNLDAVAARTEASGVSLVAGPIDRPEWGIRVDHLRDPDGNLIELNSPLPKEQWSGYLQEADERYSG